MNRRNVVIAAVAAAAVIALAGLAVAALPGRAPIAVPGPADQDRPAAGGTPTAAGVPTAATGSPTAGATAAPSPSAGARTGGPAVPAGRWRPRVGQTWQWQLSGPLDLTVAADVYDLDAFTTTAEQVATLHRAGRHVICYVNAGAYEEFRPDRAAFPKAVLGRPLDGWPGERWLDIRRWDVLEPLLARRLALCRDKGFDGVEADNVDGYDNDSGFPLTGSDQLLFNRRVAGLAHHAGLAIGLKNDVEQAGELAEVMDFAVDEECAKYRECDALAVFTRAGKPVFHAEYELPTGSFCAQTGPLGFSSIRKRPELDAYRDPCP